MVGQRKQNLEKGFQSWRQDSIMNKGIKADIISFLNLLCLILLSPIILPVLLILFGYEMIIATKEKKKQKDPLSRGHKE
jgi:hypothetical protein